MGPACAGVVQWLIDFRVPGADLRRGHAVDRLHLGALEAQVALEQLVAEPAARGLARGEQAQRVAERARQWFGAGSLAFGLAHVPEAPAGELGQFELAFDAVEPGPYHRAQR